MRVTRLGGVFAAPILTLVLLSGCAWPTHREATLVAIEAEAQRLMVAHQGERCAHLDAKQWPQAVAGLHPELVSVCREYVEIWIKPFFDGGWGYEIPHRGGDVAGPRERYTDLGHGVYWFRPY